MTISAPSLVTNSATMASLAAFHPDASMSASGPATKGLGGGGGGSHFPLERREELSGLLNAYPHPAVAFELSPFTEAGHVLLANERLDEILGFSVTDTVRLSLQHFLAAEEVPRLEGVFRQLAAGKLICLEAVKFRTKGGLFVDGRMTLKETRWAGKPLGLCVIEDIKTCRKTLAALERSEGGTSTAPLEYPTLVNLHSDIRNVSSELYRRLMIPVSKLPVVEVRVTRPQTVGFSAENANIQTMVDALNMYSRTKKIPLDKGLLIIRAEMDGGWAEMANLVRGEKEFA